jgi:plastocyanin
MMAACCAAAMVVTVGACKKGGEGGGAGGGAAAEGGAAAAFPLDTSNGGTISGRLAFSGSAPRRTPIDMGEEPVCAQKHSSPALTETVVVNDNGTLRNVFLYVKSGLPAGARFPVPAEAVEIDQDGCVYDPHVFGIQVGQTLTIRNSDGLLHNIKATPTTNRPFNISQPTNMTTARTFSTAEVTVPLQCNVHSWMGAQVGVVEHPYFAVSGADGTFRLRRLPPGTYEIEAVHERLGRQAQTVTIGPNESKEVTFTFRGS